MLMPKTGEKQLEWHVCGTIAVTLKSGTNSGSKPYIRAPRIKPRTYTPDGNKSGGTGAEITAAKLEGDI